MKVKKTKHLGVYGLLIKDENILLIKKVTGPYEGKLDLPGGSFEFSERPIQALKREFLEETGLNIIDYNIYDSDSVLNEWVYEGENILNHHIGIFYIINKYDGSIKEDIYLDDNNDDSLGAKFYSIKDLKREELSKIAIIELEKLGYLLNN